MQNIIIKSWKNRTLNQYVLEHDGSLTLFALFSLGVVAALLHEHLVKGLSLPGHHGLEWMALLLFGRMQSQDRWAGLMVASGAATTCMLYSLSLPMTESVKPALVYLMNGICVDLMISRVPVKWPLMFRGIMLGGLTFMLKPLALLPFAVLLDVVIGSFVKHGYIYPVMTHFMFGSIGATVGIALATRINKAEHEQSGKHPSS